MKSNIKISIIIPIYNGEQYIKRCFESLTNQNFKYSWELIIVDDGSTDKSFEFVKNYGLNNLKLYALKKNMGQSYARNIAIKKAYGDYIFFQDIDDLLSENCLNDLYEAATKTSADITFSDFKRIEIFENQREEVYNYETDKIFEKEDITNAMIRELHDPSLGHLGLFGCNGRLIKRDIVINNKILFEEKLRLIEDKMFGWSLLSYCKKSTYIRNQLYTYYVNPKINTAITNSLNFGFGFDKIKLIMQIVKNCLILRNLSSEEIKKNCQHGLIFFCIHALITISRPIFLKKIEFNKGKKIRRELINEILNDPEVRNAIKFYKPSKKESSFIPLAIRLNSKILLEFACNRRAKKTIVMRRTKKV